MTQEDTVSKLERLRNETYDLLDKGFVSAEFQRWHAASIEALFTSLGDGDALAQSFQGLHFEWRPEPLDRFSQGFEALTGKEFQFSAIQKERFGKALETAREIFSAAIFALSSKN